jgi:hypothetical protein
MLQRFFAKRWLVFLTTVVVHGAFTRGRAIASPDTRLYVYLADGLLAGDFSDVFNISAGRWTKTFYVLLLAFARSVSPDHWMHIMVGINVLCSGVIAVFLVDVARRATRSSVAPAAAFLLYVGSYELFQWMPFVLTDLVFCLVAFVPFALVARRIVNPDEPFRPLLLSLVLVAAVFTRPPGLLVVLLVLFAELVLVRHRLSGRVAAAIIILVAVGALSLRTAVVHDPSRWPFRLLQPKLLEFSAREKTGEVVMDRRETFRTPPRTAADHVVMQADRFARFFQFTSSAYSRTHNLINVVYFVPLYGLGLIAVFAAFRQDDRRRRAFVIAILVWIGTFAFLYAVTALDYDWRFRTPLIPHFVLLAACGVDVIAERFRRT